MHTVTYAAVMIVVITHAISHFNDEAADLVRIAFSYALLSNFTLKNSCIILFHGFYVIKMAETSICTMYFLSCISAVVP